MQLIEVGRACLSHLARWAMIALSLIDIVKWGLLWLISSSGIVSRKSPLMIHIGNVFFPRGYKREIFQDYANYVANYPASLSIYGRNKWELDQMFRDLDVVEIGSGLGQHASQIASIPARSVVGIEYQERKAKFAAERFAKSNLRFVVGAAEALPLANSCADLIFSHTVFEHLFDVSSALRECSRVLRNGGRLVIGFNHIQHRGGHHLFPYIKFPWPLGIVDEETLCKYWSACLSKDQAHGAMGFYEPGASIRSLSEGGEIHLNRMSELEFLDKVRAIGLDVDRAEPLESLWRVFPDSLMRTRIRPYIRGTIIYFLRKRA